jgi:SAM-dependent methyltransferase
LTSYNIVVVSDGEESSATFVSNELAKHSKHNWTICQFDPEPYIDKDTDIIYFHYGGMLNHRNPNLLDIITKKYLDKKKIAGIRGYQNLKRWVNEWPPQTFRPWIQHLNGISVANSTFYKIAKQIDDYIPVFLCETGVNTNMFVPTPLPKEFCIGWAGWKKNGAKMFDHFEQLPFKKKHAAVDGGTSRSYIEMPDFYKDISVYVSTSVEEGCPLPPFEAAASGRPVVAIETGCLVDWMPKEWKIKNVNTPEEWQQNWKLLIPLIQKLKDDPNLLEEESVRFRELALDHDYRIIVDQYDSMFDQVMRGREPSPRREWEVWDEEYVKILEEDWWVNSDTSTASYQMLADMIEGTSVLDVACAVGHLTRCLPEGIEYLGIDRSHPMLKRARNRHPNFKFEYGDAYDLYKFPMFDTVVSSALLIHVPDAEPIIRQMWAKARKCMIFDIHLDTKQITSRRNTMSGAKHRDHTFPEGIEKVWRVDTFGRIDRIINSLPNVKDIKKIQIPQWKYSYIYKVMKDEHQEVL